jgi:arabinogalactan endo-1,4-beta-galactosidase
MTISMLDDPTRASVVAGKSRVAVVLVMLLILMQGCAIGAERDPQRELIKGADVSMLDQLQRCGAVFSDAQGQKTQLLPLLKANGINWVRLRIWNHPVNASDVYAGERLLSHKGEPVGGGNNDLAATMRMAQAAKAQGLRLLLDFHYSDFWADPGKQDKPYAWSKSSGTALQNEVHNYTREVLLALRAANAYPDMVQLGNETNGGMLWPDGKTWRATPEETIGGAAGFAELLAAGARAVRETDPANGRPDAIRIAIHLADGGDNALYRRVFDDLQARALDFDLIGLSYYPYYHGPIAGLRANMADLAQRYGKPLLIMETATGWTLDNADATANVFGSEQATRGGYPVSPQGQEQLLRELYAALGELPDGLGLGVFWWAPEWLAVPGAGWRSGEGNGWDNQTLFDFQGRALPSLSAFARIQP